MSEGIKLELLKKSNWLREAGYTPEQEAKIYEKQLQDLYDNPRWYLDNFSFLPEYRVSWVNYKRTKATVLLSVPKYKAL